MQKLFDKLTATARVLGFDLELFPGIPVAVFISYFVFDDNKDKLLSTINLNIKSEFEQQSIILIAAVIFGVFLWAISGSILDPLFDKFSPQNRKSKSELKTRRKEAREKMIQEDNSYSDELKGIYKPIKQKLKDSNSGIFKSFTTELVVSKLFRLIVLPILILAISKLFMSEIITGVVLIIFSFGFLHASFVLRDAHLITLYTWFTENPGKQGSC